MPRNRRVNPSPFNGLTLADWQSQDALVQWARSSREYGLLLAAIQNAQLFAASHLPEGPDAAIRQAGRLQGWAECIDKLLAARQYQQRPASSPAVTFGVDPSALEDLKESREEATD